MPRAGAAEDGEEVGAGACKDRPRAGVGDAGRAAGVFVLSQADCCCVAALLFPARSLRVATTLAMLV
jgi:hypothetical protein